MKFLLDTQIVLWWPAGSRRLGLKASKLLMSDADLFISAASWWELSIKHAVGKLDIDFDMTRSALEDRGVTFLPVTFDHAERAALLPALHTDPFDRMLVAQAAHERLTLLTRDEMLPAYGAMVMLV